MSRANEKFEIMYFEGRDGGKWEHEDDDKYANMYHSIWIIVFVFLSRYCAIKNAACKTSNWKEQRNVKDGGEACEREANDA